MASTSEINQLTASERDDTVLLEKVRWSIRQRLRKQMQLLSADLFDAADDFIFSSGQQGQFGEQCNYLTAMRELRAKQKLFEEKLLETCIQSIKASYRDRSSAVSESGLPGDSTDGEVFEQVEVDLAMQSMRRKATKLYSPVVKQIEAIQLRLGHTGQALVIDPTNLLKAMLEGFQQAHKQLAIPLDVRLVFLKLYEQHFLMKLEKVFLDIVSILNNLHNPAFVDKLYSSSSSFSVTSAKTKHGQGRNSVVKAETETKESAIAATIDQLIARACAESDLPEFAEQLIRKPWREVFLVIGTNKGSESPEWLEAKHTLAMLISVLGNGARISAAELTGLTEQLRRGFTLIQMAESEQLETLTQLESFLQTVDAEAQDEANELVDEDKTVIIGETVEQNATLEASISPTGEEILDQEDLDDLAKLLGGEDELGAKNDQYGELSELLPLIDSLADEVTVHLLLDGKYEECLLNRNLSDPTAYTISKANGNHCLSRSRLGLAIALRNGELRISKSGFDSAARMQTIVDSSQQVRH
ncbi:MAG: DUF1631 domain-containing protein [Pseudomonadales bacterium]|nr:DUF1631 domain-containing protein [Pseudomonadales bacterium]